ncbi:Spatacsin like protein [Argiope bruennichi]|uniref:Spatacsin like protein n=1 Tax=Argiope bruennichi TaxID=94029 RepID=A0A8T0FC13_ARGBR|nr:Spatacsin like protein [Argiope bruennichi]
MKEGNGIEIDKSSVWTYLLEHGNLSYLINWIDIWLGVHPQNSGSVSSLDKWPLSQEMINSIPEKATIYVAEALLNELARHGIFCDEELENFPSFLTRIGQSQCDVNDISVFSSDKSSLSFHDLCHRLVHYCLKHNLNNFLYSFMAKNFSKFSVWPSCHLCNVPLLNLTKSFYKWSQNHNDPQIAYDAIAGVAQYIFRLQNTSSTELLINLPLSLALGILLFKPQSMSESISELMNCSEERRKFQQAYLSKDSAASLIAELESITFNSWNPYNNDLNALFKDIILWMPVMTLSHLHEVEAGNQYLNECASQNDWLKFLVFSQIFQIPKDQVLKAASRFANSCISYHILHSLHRKSSLLYDVAYETKNIPPLKSQKRDMRKSWYSRIGVIKGSPPADTKKESSRDEDSASITSEETTASSDVDLRSFVLKDLFSQLLLANSSDCPWDCLLHTSYEIKNPVLALLAASYPDAGLEKCFFMWLYTNLYRSEKVQKELETTFVNLNITNIISTDDLENLIILAVRNLKMLTLWQGAHLFLPDTPLPDLMGFLRSFMIYKKFNSSIESFQNQLWDYPKHSEKPSVLHSLHWLENVSVCILKEAAIACSTHYERLIMLQHFHHTKLEKTFSKDVVVPEFTKVYKMVHCLSESDLDIDIRSLFLPEDEPLYVNTCWHAIKKLLESYLYDEAQMFSNAANLPQEDMLMLQINHEVSESCKSQNWSHLSYRVEFWKDILLRLKVLKLHTIIDFLEVQCEISDKYGEKYFLMKSIIDILKENKKRGNPDVNSYDIEALNKKMWLWCIKAEVNSELLPEIFDVKKVHDFDIHNAFSDSSAATNLQHLENDSMCLDLARGEIDLSMIDMSLPNCNSEVPTSRIIRSLLLWVTSSKVISAYEKDVIHCMNNLSKKCTIAAPICHQILVHYTIAAVLEMGYMSVAMEKEPFNLLKNILVSKVDDEHILAKSLIIVHDLADAEVAKFLSEEIHRSLITLIDSDLVMIPEEKNAFSEGVIYDPLRTNEGFQLIVKLCQDPSLLGYALMNIFAAECSELNDKSPDKNNDLKEELEKALQLLSEAAKSYCKADCLHQAQTCTRLAQLVALQIYFIPSGVWIIGLDESSVSRFITDHDKFPQAYIVAEEYGNHQLWSQALLHNVVLRGDKEYLREFQSYMGLSTSLITDVVKRYQKLDERTKSPNTKENIKLLLTWCSNSKAKYILAKELELNHLAEEILKGDESAYLHDLIANNALK